MQAPGVALCDDTGTLRNPSHRSLFQCRFPCSCRKYKEMPKRRRLPYGSERAEAPAGGSDRVARSSSVEQPQPSPAHAGKQITSSYKTNPWHYYFFLKLHKKQIH